MSLRRTLQSVAAVALLASAQHAFAGDDLTWKQLAARSELWPKEVTVAHEVKFDGGAVVKAGQKVNVEKITASEIDLATTDGKLNFAADPDETDALAVANAAYAKLSPKQRELTYGSIAQQKELWPASVTITRSFKLAANGPDVNVGDQVDVQQVFPDHLAVLSKKLNATFAVTPDATDLMTQARTFVEDATAGPRFLAQQKAVEQKKDADAATKLFHEMDGKLVNSVTGKPDPLDPAATPHYLVFIRGSSTCVYTSKFAPKLVNYYNKIKAKHPDVEVIWLMTESPEDTGKFAQKLGFNWRAIDYDSQPQVPTVNNSIDAAGRLPQLIVMDPSGKVLANGVRDDAPNAVQVLDGILKHASSKQ